MGALDDFVNAQQAEYVAAARPDGPVEHRPITRREGVIDCTCGHRQSGVFITAFGAQVNFMQHLVDAVAAEERWPIALYVDGEELTTTTTTDRNGEQ